MKYKEGDYVTVRKDLMQLKLPFGVHPPMEQYMGQSFFITVVKFDKYGEVDIYGLGDLGYAFTDTMIELATLPEEYIVKCGTTANSNKVVSYFYKTDCELSFCWDYIICKKHEYDSKSFERYIREEYKHLPVFTYEQWETIKQQTEILNNMKQNMEIRNVEIPEGYEFDKIENGSIKLKKITKRILTHRDIITEESGAAGFYLGTSGVNRATLSSIMSSINGGSITDCVSRKDAERAKAFIALMRIAAYYNKNYADGWKPDWNNHQPKWAVCYIPHKNLYITSLWETTNYGEPVFATEELAQLALDNNKEIFEAYLKY